MMSSSKKIDNNPSIIPTSAFTPVNNLPSEIKDPIKISTSQKWILPARPKPGRKPLSSDDLDIELEPESNVQIATHLRKGSNEESSFNKVLLQRNNSITNTHTNGTSVTSPPKSCLPSPSPTPDALSPTLIDPTTTANTSTEKKRPVAKICPRSASSSSSCKNNAYNLAATTAATTNTTKKKNGTPHTNKMIEVDCSIIHNPMKKEILKINEENYYLKLEVIRLVSNLKNLRDEIQPIVEKRKKSNTNNTNSVTNTKNIPATTTTPDAMNNNNNNNNDNNNIPILTSVEPKEINANLESAIKKESKTNTLPAQPQPQPQQQSKKRSHDDDDINDLIVSLIDLNHSQTTIEPQNKNKNNNTVKNTTLKSNNNEKITTNINITNNITTSKDKPLESPIFKNDPFLDKNFEKQFINDEDDLISTVSTTPSTMFSLSLSATNETIDSNNINTNTNTNTFILPRMANISELPPFDLLNLPNDESLITGKLDVKLNYDDVPIIAPNSSNLKNKVKNPISILDTFNAINSNFQDEFIDDDIDLDIDDDIGSLELMNFSNQKSSSITASSTLSNEIIDFTMDEDIDLEFENFISGKNI